MRRRREVVIFSSSLLDYGGAERLVFEEARHLAERGWPTRIVTLRLDERVRFAGAYREPIDVLSVGAGWSALGRVGRFAGVQRALGTLLARRRPSLVVALSAFECALLRVPAALTGVAYVAHINGTIFWFPTDRTKYALVHRAGLRRILERSPFSRAFVGERPPPAALPRRLRAEAAAFLTWVGVRGARRRITFSRRMAWEVTQLYGVPAEELKGAFPLEALAYQGDGSDPLARFRIAGGRVVLNVNRLEIRKRVDLAIRSFALVAERRADVTLVIGGTGPERTALEALARDLGIDGRVFFAGFIPEEELREWLWACDVFLHPNWAEFAIAPYEALALGKRVVWSSEMEMDPEVAATGLVRAADPEPRPMADAIAASLDAPPPDPAVRQLLRRYSWENYFDRLARIVEDEAHD